MQAGLLSSPAERSSFGKPHGPGTCRRWGYFKVPLTAHGRTHRARLLANAEAASASVRDDKPICTLATSVRNAQGETCLVGSAVTYTVPLRRPS